MGTQKLELPDHHRPGGGFRNPWPFAEPHGFLDFLRWSLIERQRNPRRPDPDPRSFMLAAPDFIVPRAEPGTLTITWVGHTSFLVQMGGLNVLTDPMWSDRASPVRFAGPRRWVLPGIDFERLPPIDIVVLSHDHYDHLDLPTVAGLIERYPAIAWYAPLGVGASLRSHGAREVVERDWWDESSIAGLHLTCVPAQHFSGRRLRKRNDTLWCGWVLRSDDHSLLFAGDTAFHPDMSVIARRCGPFEVAILPIGAYEPRWFMSSVHMNPEDCLRAFYDLRAAGNNKRLLLVAAHWGTFKLTDEPMDEPPKRMRELWRGAGLASDDLWLMKHGETRHFPHRTAQPK